MPVKVNNKVGKKGQGRNLGTLHFQMNVLIYEQSLVFTSGKVVKKIVLDQKWDVYS